MNRETMAALVYFTNEGYSLTTEVAAAPPFLIEQTQQDSGRRGGDDENK